jgi:hypothetical protein
MLEVYNDILSSQVDILEILGTEQFSPLISKHITNKILPQKLQQNLFSKTLLSDSSTNRKAFTKNKHHLKKLHRDWKIIEGLHFPEHIYLCLYGPNKVITGVFSEENPF